MTTEEWAKDFKSYINALDMPRDDYKGIMEYIDDAVSLLKEQEAVVRCKDCLYGADFDIDVDPYVGYQCAKGYGSHLGDWFCADWGKR